MPTPANAIAVTTPGAVSFDGTLFHGGILSGANGGTGTANTNLTLDLITSPGEGKVMTSDIDGNGTWQSGGGSGFTSIVVQVFTDTALYTVTEGTRYALLEVVGGGGGGGDAPAVSESEISVGGGGSAGGYARKLVDSAALGPSQTITIGAAAGPMENGVTTSIGVLCVANGGLAGLSGESANSSVASGVIGGGAPTGDVKVQGGGGGAGFATTSLFMAVSGTGGASFYGPGALAVVVGDAQDVPGIDGVSYGSGGSGAISGANGPTSGGSGAKGYAVVTEFI
jgi:hypothetical protein